MPADPHQQEADRKLQQDILRGRTFSLADVIGREGGSFMKGDSPVPRLTQATTEINYFIAQHLADSSGALQVILQNRVLADATHISCYLDRPLVALQDMLEDLLNNLDSFYELVRQTDMKWGEMYDERPHFQHPGQEPHPEDEYTHESVRVLLERLLALVKANLP